MPELHPGRNLRLLVWCQREIDAGRTRPGLVVPPTPEILFSLVT